MASHARLPSSPGVGYGNIGFMYGVQIPPSPQTSSSVAEQHGHAAHLRVNGRILQLACAAAKNVDRAGQNAQQLIVEKASKVE